LKRGVGGWITENNTGLIYPGEDDENTIEKGKVPLPPAYRFTRKKKNLEEREGR